VSTKMCFKFRFWVGAAAG